MSKWFAYFKTFFAWSAISLVLFGCGIGGAANATSPTTAVSQPTNASSGSQAGQGKFNTVFPLPDDATGFAGAGGDAQLNFQTNLRLPEIMSFYRQVLTKKGLTERTENTRSDDKTFNLVFDGWGNGKALVIQGVDLGASRNVNIRFESI